MSVFNNYSEYYDLLYKDKDYDSEVNYILTLIKKYFIGKPQSVLSLGCGTGIHESILAKYFSSIVGVDLSESMIEIARNKHSNCNAEKLKFLVSDICTLQLNQSFDIVTSLFHVASYQTSNDALMQYFNTAYNHLNTNGIFIFDFWYGPAVLTDRPQTRIKRIENNNLTITRLTESHINFNENIVDVNFEVIVENKQSGGIDKIKETHKMRYLFLPEIKYMLLSIGFKNIVTHKWMSIDEDLSENTWYGLIVVQK